MALMNSRPLIQVANLIKNRINTSQALFFNQQICVYSSESLKDVPTHTGQQWDQNDVRLARFENNKKQINPRFAIDLIAQVPPKVVKERVIACEGGGGALGHPKVYINVDKPGNHICGYCGLRFVKEDDHHH
nr:EOG090X0NBY [Cyclestheria hislopi]